LVSSRGIVSFRVPQALYQAWRIAQLLKGVDKPRVLEIGGGLGRTAFYARQFGIRDYTIIDIPVSSLAQGYFLGRTLGEEQVSLFGETAGAEQVKIMPPGFFLDGTDRYDLVVNVDSLTEIGRVAADQYWSAIEARASKFLSINHEANEFTVAQLISEAGHSAVSRTPYWMRRGFVEEVVEFATQSE
jgi:putative sugar O-methyltransferase